MKSIGEKIRNYFPLIKSLQTGLLISTGLAGYMSARCPVTHPATMLGLLLSLFASISGSTILNMWWDRDIDAKMGRTQKRPLATGKVSSSEALRVGLALSALGVGLAAAMDLLYGLIIFAGLFSAIVGIALGAIAGYAGGTVDYVIQGLVDISWAFPTVLMAIFMVAVLGPGLMNVMIAVGLVPERRPDARKRKWSPQRVLECLRFRHQEGKSMHYTPMHAEDNPLLCAAKKYFDETISPELTPLLPHCCPGRPATSPVARPCPW